MTRGASKLTDQQRSEIVNLEGRESSAHIAFTYGISKRWVYKLWQRDQHQNHPTDLGPGEPTACLICHTRLEFTTSIDGFLIESCPKGHPIAA